MEILKAGALYFAFVFGAGFLLGGIRVPLLVPRFGERTAELMEMPIMFVSPSFPPGGSFSVSPCRPHCSADSAWVSSRFSSCWLPSIPLSSGCAGCRSGSISRTGILYRGPSIT